MSAELPPPTSWTERWKSFQLRGWLRGLISPQDTPHQLALGASVGMFVAFTPLFGLHLMIIVAVAFLMQRLVRFNKVVAIATCYINNPVTFAPMLWASYEVGIRLVSSKSGPLDPEKLPPGFDWSKGIQALPKYLYGIGWPLLVGSLVLGVVAAMAIYPVTFGLVKWFRRSESPSDQGASIVSTALNPVENADVSRP